LSLEFDDYFFLFKKKKVDFLNYILVSRRANCRRPPDAHSCLIGPSKKTAPAYSDWIRRKSPHGYPVPIHARRIHTHIFTHVDHLIASTCLCWRCYIPLLSFDLPCRTPVSHNSSFTFLPVSLSKKIIQTITSPALRCVWIHFFLISQILPGVTIR